MKSLGLIKRIFLLKKISKSKSKSEREDILFRKVQKREKVKGEEYVRWYWYLSKNGQRERFLEYLEGDWRMGFERKGLNWFEVVTLSRQGGTIMYQVYTLNWIQSRTPYGMITVS